MIRMTLGEIAEAVSGKLVVGDSSLATSGQVFTDSREVGPGDIFFAKVGELDDGHKYIPQVSTVGATLAVVQEPRTDLPIAQIVVSDSVVALANLAREVLRRVREKGSHHCQQLCRVL